MNNKDMMIGGMDKDIEHIKDTQNIIFKKIKEVHVKLAETSEKHDEEQLLIKTSLFEIATTVSKIHQPCQTASETSVELKDHKEEHKTDLVKISLFFTALLILITLFFKFYK